MENNSQDWVVHTSCTTPCKKLKIYNGKIMDFRSMSYNGKLDREEIGTLCELYANGTTMTELTEMFNMHTDKIYEYLRINYFGVYPKFFTAYIVVSSRLNDDDLFFE